MEDVSHTWESPLKVEAPRCLCKHPSAFFYVMQLNEAVGLESLYYTFGHHISYIVLLFDKGKNTLKGLKFTYKR